MNLIETEPPVRDAFEHVRNILDMQSELHGLLGESELIALQAAINEDIENPSRSGVENRVDVFTRGININETTKERIKIVSRNVIRTRSRYEISQNTLQTISDFLNDENYLENKENLRSFVNTIAYLKPYDERQYHLALVFDKNGLQPIRGSERGWTFFNTQEQQERGDYKPQEHLLGVIVTMPNRELVQKIVELSSRSGELAHPVIDGNGAIRWPTA